MPTATDYPTEMRVIRQHQHLTQSEIAALLGITGNSVMRYETGVRQVPEPTRRLARHLVCLKMP